MKKEFISVFKITKMVMFEVRYRTLSDNESPYFATSAVKFIRSKRDYETCGQCQNTVLPKGSFAREFYKKWDEKHLKDLNDSEYNNLMNDIKKLKEEYNHIYIEQDTFKNQNSTISFNDIKELSMTR